MSELLTNTSFSALGELVHSRRRIVVCSHVRPDGDALGSCLALALALERLGREVRVLSEDGVPENLGFIHRAEELVKRPSGKVEADVVFALDTATRDRLGPMVIEAIAAVPLLVNIDHHISNKGYGDLFYVDGRSPATAQIIFEFLRSEGLPLDRGIAEALYTGISTDTGSFQYGSTTSATYRAAAELVDLGVEVGELNRRIYQSQPLRRVKLLCELLNVLRLTADGRCASWSLSREMAQRVDSRAEDTENLIDHIRGIEGVVVAAFFEELNDGRVRLSLRSKDPRIDVSALCQKFGGGGHRMAAGARLPGPLTAAEEKVLSAIHEALAAV